MNPARPGSCSTTSALVGEQLEGSAPEAVGWLALEQPGPWGAKALTASHLDRTLGAAVEAAAAAHGVRPVLVRRPGRHADRHPDHAHDARRLLVAHTRPGSTWLLSGVLAAPEDVLAVDWAAIRDGDRDAVRRSLPVLDVDDRAHLLVCTNGTRDVCCAVVGRPVALGAAARYPDRVWEVTHTSGHRFAPTAVVLPAGTLHGRLDVERAAALLAAADLGSTVLDGSRGRSTWPPAAQVAELAVRRSVDEAGLDAVAVESHETTEEHASTSVVAHADGRRWRVEVASVPSAGLREESCGKPAKPLRRWTWSVEPLPVR